jgi:hypothetical protein
LFVLPIPLFIFVALFFAVPHNNYAAIKSRPCLPRLPLGIKSSLTNSFSHSPAPPHNTAPSKQAQCFPPVTLARLAVTLTVRHHAVHHHHQHLLLPLLRLSRLGTTPCAN